jgi:hypothetical protein
VFPGINNSGIIYLFHFSGNNNNSIVRTIFNEFSILIIENNSISPSLSNTQVLFPPSLRNTLNRVTVLADKVAVEKQ